MNLTCYLIDDEYHALEVLGEYIRQTPGLELIGQTTNPLTGLNAVTGADAPDLTFLDVDMPELSGLTLAGLINHHTTVIFTTAHREYAADAFEKDAADYLLKPIFYERFLHSVQKAQRRFANNVKTPASIEKTAVFVKTGIKGQVRSLQVADIVYARAALNYIEIILKADKIITYLKLDEMLAKLPAGQFSRIHKSYLVNHEFIQTMEYAQVRLKTTEKITLPIGRTFRKNFREKMNDLLLISTRVTPPE
jgi:DNA-binding LytR/AlgR family response regulator